MARREHKSRSDASLESLERSNTSSAVATMWLTLLPNYNMTTDKRHGLPAFSWFTTMTPHSRAAKCSILRCGRSSSMPISNWKRLDGMDHHVRWKRHRQRTMDEWLDDTIESMLIGRPAWPCSRDRNRFCPRRCMPPMNSALIVMRPSSTSRSGASRSNRFTRIAKMSGLTS